MKKELEKIGNWNKAKEVLQFLILKILLVPAILMLDLARARRCAIKDYKYGLIFNNAKRGENGKK